MRRTWPLGVADDPTHPRRIGGEREEERARSAGSRHVRRADRCRVSGLISGSVAVDDQDGSWRRAARGARCAGVAGAERGLLLDAGRGVAEQVARTARSPRAVTTTGLASRGRVHGVDDGRMSGATAERMKHLGESAAHPFALPRGEDHRVGPVTHVLTSIRARRSRASRRRPYDGGDGVLDARHRRPGLRRRLRR